MTVKEIQDVLGARLFTGEENLSLVVQSACSADLMSDVMAFVKEDVVLLLTGLMNIQTIRTACLLDIQVIVFVRGKSPSDEMVNLAREEGITLLSTDYSLFLASGRLYTAGLQKGGTRVNGQ